MELSSRPHPTIADLRIIRLVGGEPGRLIAGGVTAGLAGALLLSRVLQSFLYQVESNDPATLIIVALLFVGVALLACWAPVRRATRVHPAQALRCE